MLILISSSPSPAVTGGVTTAHQVPAVSQSAYSPPTPETPDSILSTPPQTLLSKSLPPSLPLDHSIPHITAVPPTQPTTKVRLISLCTSCEFKALNEAHKDQKLISIFVVFLRKKV